MAILSDEFNRVLEAKRTSVSIRIENMAESFPLSIRLSTRGPDQQIAFIADFMKCWRSFVPRSTNEISLLFPVTQDIVTHKLCVYEPCRGSQLGDEKKVIVAYYPRKPHIPEVHHCQPLFTLRGPATLVDPMYAKLVADMVKVPSKNQAWQSMHVYEE